MRFAAIPIIPMPRRRSIVSRLVFVAVLGAAVAAGGSAAAQEQSAGAALGDEEEAMLLEGIELRRAGKDEEALEVFLALLRRSPESVRARVHLATAYQALGRWLAAELHLDQALANEGHPFIERHRELLEEASRVVKGHIGRVEVAGNHPGATVRIDGRVVGTLPLQAPARVLAGRYQLEVTASGHYPVSRRISVQGNQLVRETVELSPIASGELLAGASATPADSPTAQRLAPAWVPWTLGGAAVAAGGLSVFGVVRREQHADKWNSADCISTTQTRAELCASERSDGRQMERLAIAGGVGAAVLATGALVSALWRAEPVTAAERVGAAERAKAPEPERLAVEGCTLMGVGLACFGAF